MSNFRRTIVALAAAAVVAATVYMIPASAALGESSGFTVGEVRSGKNPLANVSQAVFDDLANSGRSAVIVALDVSESGAPHGQEFAADSTQIREARAAVLSQEW
jgi:hypothetical protein